MASESQSSTPSIPIRTESEMKTLHEEWLIKHKKSYKSEEEKEERFKIFKDNLKYIDEHNAGNHSFQLGLNIFSDLTNEEYRSTYLGFKPPPEVDNQRQSDHSVGGGDEDGEGYQPPKVGLANQETSA
ncbi:Actinidain protein [Dioscorea alata]|uniref:Actinidain protein n=1 Tax=Dioscorea alata TaxID=55571 RepID=A0ACB7TSK0_DIOAL|nr:Actinidain protein [Dioscorea alata]